MARKLKTRQGHATHARRKAIVKPVFGQMQTVDAHQLLLRGKPAARAQWRFPCAIHLLKLHRNGGLALPEHRLSPATAGPHTPQEPGPRNPASPAAADQPFTRPRPAPPAPISTPSRRPTLNSDPGS